MGEFQAFKYDLVTLLFYVYILYKLFKTNILYKKVELEIYDLKYACNYFWIGYKIHSGI